MPGMYVVGGATGSLGWTRVGRGGGGGGGGRSFALVPEGPRVLTLETHLHGCPDSFTPLLNQS